MNEDEYVYTYDQLMQDEEEFNEEFYKKYPKVRDAAMEEFLRELD